MCRNYFSTFFHRFNISYWRSYSQSEGSTMTLMPKAGVVLEEILAPRFWRTAWRIVINHNEIILPQKKSVAIFIIFLCFSYKEAPSFLIRPCFFLWMSYHFVFRIPPQIFIKQTKKNNILLRPWKIPSPQHEQRKNPGCLGYIGDYTTQLYGDYNKPL